MGLVQAVVGAVGGVLGDQWKDFYTVPQGLPSTAALFAAVPQGTNAGRGSNTSGSSNIITNGSKIVVPEGYGLLLMQDGAITAFYVLLGLGVVASSWLWAGLLQRWHGGQQLRRLAGDGLGQLIRLGRCLRAGLWWLGCFS